MTHVSKLKVPGKITAAGRGTSISGAFSGAILPRSEPSEDEKLETLAILKLDPERVTCAYCGDDATEWDHLNPTVKDRFPTGFRTEVANLVPSCGKCNQSKGNKPWRDWIQSDANRSPKRRGILDLERRIQNLDEFARQHIPVKISLSSLHQTELWGRYWAIRDDIVEKLKLADEIAGQIHEIILASSDINEGIEDRVNIVPLGAEASEVEEEAFSNS